MCAFQSLSSAAAGHMRTSRKWQSADPKTIVPLPRASCVGAFAPGLAGFQPAVAGMGVEPTTARLTAWCSTSELTSSFAILVRTHVRNTPKGLEIRDSASRWPDGKSRLLRKRRRWESHPLGAVDHRFAAVPQAAAVPSGSSVVTKAARRDRRAASFYSSLKVVVAIDPIKRSRSPGNSA